MGHMRTLRPIAVGALTLSAALLLTGCLDAGFPGSTATTPPATPSAPATSSQATTTTPTTGPSQTPEPTAAPGIPVTIDCQAILTPDGIYDIDPNLTVVPLDGPPSTRFAQESIADDGTVCHVTHATTGASAFIGVSAPAAARLAEQRAAAGAGSPLGTTGTEVHGAATQLQVFHDERRVTGECDPAFNPDSLRAMLELAISNGA